MPRIPMHELRMAIRDLVDEGASRAGNASWTGGIGAGFGGLSTAASGGDGEDVGRGAAVGAALGGAPMLALGRVGALPAIIGAIAANPYGAYQVRGDVDAAARKILQYARNRDEIQRVGELLWGDAERPDELSRGYKGRAQSIYGIGGFERPGTAIANVDRDAAIRRAVEMADERGMR